MTARARVLFISGAGERGGAETVLLTLLRHLDRRRVDPIVVSLRDGPLVRDLANVVGRPVTVLSAPRFRQLARGAALVGALMRFVRDSRIDLVHANGTGSHLYGGLAAWRAGVPCVYHAHDVVESTWSAQTLLQRLALRVPARAVVAVSEYAATSLRAAGARAPVHVIYNGVEVDAPGAAERPGGWPPEHAAPRIVWCGRLQRWKGPHVFVEAAARVRREVPAARFVVVGGSPFGLEPELPAELERLRNRWHLDTVLELTGHLEDPRPILGDAAVVVDSSVQPGTASMVLLEAMALGKAVVGSRVGGVPEYVEDGVTGVLVPPGEVDALADAIVRLLADDGERARLGAEAHRRVAERFSAAAASRRMEALYDALLASTPARSG